MASVRIAVVSSALYVAWLVAFERGLEPLARRFCGALFRRRIGWVQAGPFRVWGSGGHVARDGAIAGVGTLVVLGAAALPVVAFHFAARLFEGDAERIRDWAYLMTVPLVAVFVLRVLWREATAG